MAGPGFWDHQEKAQEAVGQLKALRAITAPLEEYVTFFHDRPFRVIHGGRFAEAIIDAIDELEVQDLVQRSGLIGAIDQITDNVDVLSNPEQYVKFRTLYASVHARRAGRDGKGAEA